MQILNRRAPYEYILLDRIEAGIMLAGSEVKSIKNGRLDLSTSFARINNGEVYLVNANIPPYQGGVPENYDPSRSRKLLLSKDEILSWETKSKQQKLTIVPTKVYTKGQLVKVELALAKPKRQFEKREAKRKKDVAREVERELRLRG
ncbi:SsrA-binding protein SmpB [Candidatus Microgenomates bacterium]|nr:SsrA-binding protein SmpB [Candidatus Microgenomates bacterium]